MNKTEEQLKNLKFTEGRTSTAEFVRFFCYPLFQYGIVHPFPGADNYTIAYGDLCAYDDKGTLLATWSATVPDCVEDLDPHDTYDGKWDLE